MSYQEKKRIKSVPQKFRQPTNTDAELNAAKSKRKKKANIVAKAAKEKAKTQNMAHLTSVFKNATSVGTTQESPNSDVNLYTSASANDHENMELDYNQVTPENLPIELPSATSNNFASIVREALGTLEGDGAMNGFSFTAGDVFEMDDYLNEGPKDTLNDCVDDRTPQVLNTTISSTTASNNSIHEQHYSYSVTKTPTATPSTLTSAFTSSITDNCILQIGVISDFVQPTAKPSTSTTAPNHNNLQLVEPTRTIFEAPTTSQCSSTRTILQNNLDYDKGNIRRKV